MSKKIPIPGFALCALLVAFCYPSAAQQQGRAHRVGILATGSPGGRSSLDAFRSGLRDLGYIEGKNVTIDYRYAEEQYDRLPGLAAELVSLKPDVIMTHSTPAALAVKQATSTIPVVIAAAGDLVLRGIVLSLARPGRNITGLTFPDSAQFFGKQLEILKESAPKVARVTILLNPANPAWKDHPHNLKGVPETLGLRLQRADADDPADFESVFSKLTKGRGDGLLVANDTLFSSYRMRITELALENQLPSISQMPGYTESGGLIQYGWDTLDMFRRAAVYVDKILKGAKPADLPVERPSKYELVINLKTAKQIGLTIPPNVLARADRVIR